MTEERLRHIEKQNAETNVLLKGLDSKLSLHLAETKSQTVDIALLKATQERQTWMTRTTLAGLCTVAISSFWSFFTGK
jgi:hypothetical protein